jgi:hypothetical protein
VLVTRHAILRGDGNYFHLVANFLADGRGFIEPAQYYLLPGHPAVQQATHPPAYALYLAIASVAGLRSTFAHQIWSCVLGATAIAVIALAGRAIAGRRAGLLAALLAAVNPNFWLFERPLLSETMVLLASGLTVLAAYSLWRVPDWKRALALGAACALSALTRAELILLLPMFAVSFALLMRPLQPRRRFALGGVILVGGTLLVAPWVGYNLERFDQPVIMTSNVGTTARVSNCIPVYSGELIGYWAYPCVGGLRPDRCGKGCDLSTVDVEYRRLAVRYIRSNLSRLPAVVFAREGRTWGFFRPGQQLRLDRGEYSRPTGWSLVGLVGYYVIVPLSVVGAVSLRKRGVPIFPLVILIANVVISVAMVYGQTRFRAPADIALVLLASVALDRYLPSGTDGFLRRRPRPVPARSTQPGRLDLPS